MLTLQFILSLLVFGGVTDAAPLAKAKDDIHIHVDVGSKSYSSN